MATDPIAVALRVARVLEALGVPYLIGGSVASTVHGEPRMTLDVDFAIQLEPTRAEELVLALGDEFYADIEMVREAARYKRMVNVIHRPTMVKADLYVRPPEGIYAAELARALVVSLEPGPSGHARVASAEDSVLQKLLWYERGERVSDRQWRDVLGIVKAVGPRLDRAYLSRWAADLGIMELLERAFREAGSK